MLRPIVISERRMHPSHVITQGLNHPAAPAEPGAAPAPRARLQIACRRPCPAAEAALGLKPAAPAVLCLIQHCHDCCSRALVTQLCMSRCPTKHRHCMRELQSRTHTVATHGNKPRQSKQLVRAAIAVVLDSAAIASAITPANPVAAVHTACAPLSRVAAPRHRYRVHAPWQRKKTSRGRANSSCVRQ